MCYGVIFSPLFGHINFILYWSNVCCCWQELWSQMMGMPFCVSWILLTQQQRCNLHIPHCKILFSTYLQNLDLLSDSCFFSFVFTPFPVMFHTRLLMVFLNYRWFCCLKPSLISYSSLFYMIWQSMIELSRTQDEEVGDGTTSVIVLGKPIIEL